MKKLRISTGLQLPADEAVTRSFGILGMRGSGKSNAAVVMAEEMFRVGLHWVAIDPKGDWWGIRAGKDGKAGGGLPVVIFGGEHADVPLEPTAKAGVLVADLILNEGITCVLDLSDFTKNGKVQFLAGPGKEEGFAGRLFRKKRRDQDPIHMFLEEAHDYVPQQARGELGKMVDAVSNLQTMGRTKGLGCSVISQRSARVHKDVLTQVDTLLVFRTLGPQDRDAIAAWVKYHGMGEELLASLATLAAGESWLWSPEWLQVMKRIQWRQRETFDSGATPTTGTTRRSPATLADVDLEAVTAQMKETIERAKADDPKELRKQLAEANRRLRELEARPAAVAEAERIEVPVEVPTIDRADVEALTSVVGSMTELAGGLLDGATGLSDALKKAWGIQMSGPARATGALATSPSPAPATPRRKGGQVPGRGPVPMRPPAPSKPRDAPAPSLDGFTPTRSMQAVLDALAWFESVGITEIEREPLAPIAGSRAASSGGFKNNLGALRSAGLVDYPTGGTVALTEAGRAVADHPSTPLTQNDLLDAVYSKLTASQSAMLGELVAVYPDSLSREELADRLGVPVTSGGFKNNLGRLRSLKFVEYPMQSTAAATSLLFLE